MGDLDLRPRLRRTGTLLGTTALAATLALAGPATARPCHGCEDPELPGPGGPGACPTITATVDPSIVTPAPYRVGQTIVGNRGVWSNTADSYLGWWYAGPTAVGTGFPIGGPTTSYTITPDDLDKPLRLAVRARGVDPTCTKTEYSEETPPVVKGAPPVVSTMPTITGDARVGGELTVTDGEWSRDFEQITFEWRRDGEQVGTGRTYTPVVADRGRVLQARVRVRTAGYEDGVADVPTPQIGPGPAPTPSLPLTIEGDLRVGEVLRLPDVTWSPVPDQISYTWYTEGGGGSGPSYTVVPGDVGHRVQLVVQADRDGHVQRTTNIFSDGVVRPGRLARAGAAKVTGKRVVGGRLAVDPGTWTPAADAVAVQWLRAGKPIGAATKRTYRPRPADAGRALSVRVTGTRPGFDPQVSVVPVGRIAKAAAPAWKGKKPRVVWKNRTRGVVKASLGKAKIRKRTGTPKAAVRFRWLRNGKVIKGANRAVYRVRRADRGARLRLRVVVAAPGRKPLRVASPVVRVRVR